MGENDPTERPNKKWQCERQVGQQQRNKWIRGWEKEPIEYDWCGTSVKEEVEPFDGTPDQAGQQHSPVGASHGNGFVGRLTPLGPRTRLCSLRTLTSLVAPGASPLATLLHRSGILK